MLRIDMFYASFVLGFVTMIAAPNLAESAEPIRYLLRFPAPQTHYVEVERAYPCGQPLRSS